MNRTIRTLTVGLTLAMSGVVPAQYIEQRPWAVVRMEGHEFVPETIAVPAGTTIVWANYDDDVHAVYTDSPLIGPHSRFVYRNGYPGGYYYWWQVPYWVPSGTVIYYHCPYHGTLGNGQNFGTGMVGRIVVI